MKRFIDLGDLSRDEVLALLELARRLEKQPEPRADQCRVGTSVTASPLPSSTRSRQSKLSALMVWSASRMVTSLPSGVITRGAKFFTSLESVAVSR